jgi:hypothetical protein
MCTPDGPLRQQARELFGRKTMPTEELEITIEIVCTRLPGLQYEGRGPMHLGIQQDESIIELAPADRDRIVFLPALRVRKHTDGSANFLGPFAHGPRAERFIYLNWVIVHNKIPVERVGRIKLHLSHIQFKNAQTAAASKKPIKVTLELTSEKGKPVFASVRASSAKWEL